MPNYKAMYFHLFREFSKAIEILQNAQRKTEEMYINAPDVIVHIIKAGHNHNHH